MSDPPTDNATTSVPGNEGILCLKSWWAVAIPIGIILFLACVYFCMTRKLLRRMRDSLKQQRKRETSKRESGDMELAPPKAAADYDSLANEPYWPPVAQQATTSFTGEATVQHRLSHCS